MDPARRITSFDLPLRVRCNSMALATGELLLIYMPYGLFRMTVGQTRDNVRFAMSQELAQDEAEADAEDYEIDSLENGHRRLPTHDDDEDGEADGHASEERGLTKDRGGLRGEVGDESVVFAMGEDSDEEGSEGEGGTRKGNGYRDEEGEEGRKREGKDD